MAALSPYQIDILAKTVAGEALGEGPQGQAAVAHVLRNRTRDGRWPRDPAAAALQPKQFSAWNAGEGGNNIPRTFNPDNPKYAEIEKLVQDVWNEVIPDPTGGATHYYAPQGMPGGRAPGWWNENAPTVEIGNQRFQSADAGGNMAFRGTGVGGMPANNAEAAEKARIAKMLMEGGPQPIATGPNVRSANMANFTIPEAPGDMEVAQRNYMAQRADEYAPQVNNGTIAGGLASVLERFSGAYNRGQAQKAGSANQKALVEVLGGTADPLTITDQQIAQAEYLVPGSGAQLAQQRAEAMDIRAREEMQGRAQAFQSAEGDKRDAARIQAAREGKPQTTVNVGKGETKYDETIGTSYGNKFVTLQDEADKARGSISNIDSMMAAVNDPNFYSGIMAENVVLPFKRAVVALGGDADEVVSMETFNAQSKKAVLDAVGGSLGNQISNSDRSFIEQQAAGLQNTPDGNRRLLEIARKVQQRKIEVADMARQYAAENQRIDPGFDQRVAEWAEANPLFPQQDGELTGKNALEETKRRRGVMPGAVEDGYRFKGGNPADPDAWEKVQ